MCIPISYAQYMLDMGPRPGTWGRRGAAVETLDPCPAYLAHTMCQYGYAYTYP
jgi:hypothetical protein